MVGKPNKVFISINVASFNKMKFVHIYLTGPFTDGLMYQENLLIEQHVLLGHDVTVIAATETFGKDKKIKFVDAGTSYLKCGAKLVRLPYVIGLFKFMAKKIRAYRGLMQCIKNENPDRILFHGLTAWDLLTVARYVRNKTDVQLFADCHEDFNNSAMTWASRELLHKRFYKPIFNFCCKQIKEILCVTIESYNFAVDFYDSPKDKTRLFPLGCVIESHNSIQSRRKIFRKTHGYNESHIVITQTGKLDRTKKLIDTLQSFIDNKSPQLRLLIAGQMVGDVKNECHDLINSDERITYLGWQSADNLLNVLAGADFFLQPFGQTTSTQMAMGCGCVILAQDLPSHRWLIGANGYLFKDSSELPQVFNLVLSNQDKIEHLKLATMKFARDNLDYKILAQQIIQ